MGVTVVGALVAIGCASSGYSGCSRMCSQWVQWIVLPVGGVEDKQELITLGVTGCLVPRPSSAAPALDFYKDFCFRYLEIFHVSFI